MATYSHSQSPLSRPTIEADQLVTSTQYTARLQFASVKGIPKGFLAKLFLGGLGYQGQQTTHFQKHTGVLALPPKAARPKNNDVHRNVWFVGLGTPGLQKTLGQKNTSG